MRKSYLDFIVFKALFRIHSLILATEQILSVFNVYKEVTVLIVLTKNTYCL